MSVNLLDLLKGQLTGNVIGKIGGLLNESESNTSNAVSKMLPSILGGLMSKSKETGGPATIFDLLKGGGYDGSMFDNLGDLLSGGDKTNSFMDSGAGLTKAIFGNKTNGIMDVISSAIGMGNRSSSSLMSLLLPMAMGMIGKITKKDNLDAGGVASLLQNQQTYIKDKVPAGLFESLGLGGLAAGTKKAVGNTVDTGKRAVSGTVDAGKKVAGGTVDAGRKVAGGTVDAGRKVAGGTVDAGRKVASGTTEVAKSGGSILMKIIPIALIAAIALFAWRMCGTQAVNTTKGVAGSVVEGTKNVAGSAVDATKNAADKVGNAAGNAADKVGNAAGNVVEGTKNVAGKVGNAAGNVADKAGNAASNVVQGTKNAADKAGNAVGNAAGAVTKGAKDVVGGAADAVKGAGAKLGEMMTFNKKVFSTAISNPRGDISKSFLLDKVTFDTGSANLASSSQAQLREIADALKANPKVQIQLQGHTDNVGARASNITLSQKRADAVKAFLVRQGVPSRNMTTKGFGPDAPRFANDTPANKAKNRRTELKVTKR